MAITYIQIVEYIILDNLVLCNYVINISKKQLGGIYFPEIFLLIKAIKHIFR